MALSVRPEFGNSLAVPELDVDADMVLSMLDAPGRSPYTPELTEQSLDLIRRRARANRDELAANAQSDMLARGGTGSSTELFALNDARARGTQAEEDQVLQFLLGASDRAAEDRRFRVGTGLDLHKTGVGRQEAVFGRQFNYGSDVVGREHEERLADKWMAQLAAQQAADRKRRRKLGVVQGLTTLAGAGIGAWAGGPAGAGAGASVGSSLPFLFS
jgi:hypothetical protein